MSLPLAGYIRVSRVGDRGERLISPELQADRIRSYASTRGLDVEFLPPELDVSGGRVDRPILGEVIAGIESRRYAGVIVAQLDRLSRMDITEALHAIRRIENLGGEVIAVAENFDAGTPEGRMGRTVVLAMGEMQLDRYKAQFRAAKGSAVARGVWPMSIAPLGYTVHRRKDGGDGRLRIDPESAPRVIAAFKMRAAGASWGAVATFLDKGISGAGKVIRNRVYLGEIHVGDWYNLSAHEPLVTRDIWEAAQLKRPRPPRGTHGPSLLTGLVICGGCGYRMSPDANAKMNMYRCVSIKARGKCPAASIISRDKLDPYVTALALSHLDSLAFEGTQRTDDLDRALGKLNAAQAELEAYNAMTRVTEVGPEAFMGGLQPRLDAVEDAGREVGRARARSGPAEVKGTLSALWPDLSIEERGHVLRGALSAVVVRKAGQAPVDLARVRVFAAGASPVVGEIDWFADAPPLLEGEVRMALAQDIE